MKDISLLQHEAWPTIFRICQWFVREQMIGQTFVKSSQNKCQIYIKTRFESLQKTKVVFIRLGIYLFVNKARGVGGQNFLFIRCDVTSI